MSSTKVLVLTGAMLVAIAPAAAQSRVAVGTVLSTSRPDTTTLIHLPSQRVEAVVPVNLVRSAFTGSGRYFIAVEENLEAAILLRLWVVDLQTGAMWTQDLPGYNGAYVTANPRRDEVYVVWVHGFDGTLAVVRPDGMRLLRSCEPTPAAVSRDGRRVFCHDRSEGVVQIDADTGDTVGSFDAGGIGVLFTDAAGTTVTIWRDGLAVFDVATGELMQSAPLPHSPGMQASRPLGDGHEAGGLFIHGRNGAAGETVLVDPLTLTARQRLPIPPDREVLNLKVLPNGRTALITSRDGLRAMVDAVDLVENRITFSTPMFAAWQAAFLSVTSAPLAPVSLTASVSGGQVQLSWTLPAASDGVSHWIVEAGSRSGAADLARLQATGPDESLLVDNVPAGRYFVRIRAANANGLSAPSSEVVVDVPRTTP